MRDNNQRLEAEVLRLLLDGDDPVLNILREQLAHVVSTKRECTGVGFYVDFTLSDDAPRLPGNPSFTLGDVIPEIEGLELGGALVLFVKDGLLSMLEGSSYGDSWPATIGRFHLQYETGKERDLAALRRTPGWPGYKQSIIPLVHPSESLAAMPARLTYALPDFCFSFVHDTPGGFPTGVTWPPGIAFLCFDQLEIHVNLRDRQWGAVAGRANYETWTRSPLATPGPVRTCGLVLDDFTSTKCKGYYGVDDVQFKKQYFDMQTGWFCTGDPNARTDVVVQFATNCFAALREGRVVAIWLHPENWPSIVNALELT